MNITRIKRSYLDEYLWDVARSFVDFWSESWSKVVNHGDGVIIIIDNIHNIIIEEIEDYQ